MGKDLIRKQMKLLRKQVTIKDRTEYSKRIAKTLYQLPQYKNCDVIYSYVSYQEEVITHSMIEHALQEGKEVAVPKVIGKRIEFYKIQSMKDLEEGYWGILEPILTDKPAKDRKALMIMPGLAFDKKGNRIGYGGGYYDKYLQEHKEIDFYKACVAFDFQILDEVESMPYDITVDCIITPTRLYKRE